MFPSPFRATKPSAAPTTAAPILLPAADAVQPDHACQWWYWSGRLRTRSGRAYGFQAAFFAAEAVRGVLWGQMAHWALVELDTGRFHRGSRVWLGAPRRIEGRFLLETPRRAAWPTADPCASPGLSAAGGGGDDRLCLRLGDLALDLRACGGPVALHYDGCAHDYAFGGYTYYYSRPRMAGMGELRRGSTREAVTGDVWFDRQYGALTGALAEGWQWLSIHLDDGVQLMVFGWNRAAAERFASITDGAGRTRWLQPHDFVLEPRGCWRSPRSGIEYPCAWRLRTDAHDLDVRATVPDQEMSDAAWLGPVYWEGACEVSGSHHGVAYVELLGSLPPVLAERGRPDRAHAGPLSRAVAVALQHPAIALGVATGVGWVSARVPGLRPRFAMPPRADQPGRALAEVDHQEPLRWTSHARAM